jgi:hypothetical protein
MPCFSQHAGLCLICGAVFMLDWFTGLSLPSRALRAETVRNARLAVFLGPPRRTFRGCRAFRAETVRNARHASQIRFICRESPRGKLETAVARVATMAVISSPPGVTMTTKTSLPIVRAADVGYGHIKWTDGRDPGSDLIRCDRCPSLSPPARELGAAAGVMQSRDTFHVNVGGRHYEVGKAVHRAMHANQESSVMDQDFCLSDAYQARLYGALNYMSMGIEGGRIDFLILGLPMNIYLKHADAVSERYQGVHTINTKGDRLAVGRCIVYPQPLGSYADFLDSTAIEGSPNALVVDVGFNTVDWLGIPNSQWQLSSDSTHSGKMTG